MLFTRFIREENHAGYLFTVPEVFVNGLLIVFYMITVFGFG